MKRKPAKRKTKNRPGLIAKPLRELWEKITDPAERERFTILVGSGIAPTHDIPLPPDLENALRFFSREESNVLVSHLREPPFIPVDQSGEEYEMSFEPVSLEKVHAAEIQYSIKRAIRIGFNLALLRYADDLKNVPEAAMFRSALERGRKKGGAATKKKSEPDRKAARKRFRELRKSGFSKTAARKVLEQDTGFSMRTIERYTSGLS